MSSPARIDSSDVMHPGEVVPIHPTKPSQVPVALLPPTQPELVGRRAGELLGSASRTITRACARTMVSVSDTCAGFASRAGELARRVRVQGENLKNDRPVTTLGIIAGLAFAVGVAARAWRSRD